MLTKSSITMKKIFASLLCLIVYLGCIAQTEKPTSEIKALKKIEEIQSVLTLTQEQTVTLKNALITRYEAINTFELKHEGKKDLIKAEKKKQKEVYKNVFNKTLTKEQLKKWKAHRESEKKAAKKIKE